MPDASPKQIFIVSGSGETAAASTPLIYPPQPQVLDEAIAELKRTPNFSTFQDIPWLVHHDDFMAYLGIWGPEDVTAVSSPDTAREVFLEMVDHDDRALWPEGKSPRFGNNLVTFQCLRCQAYRGILDFD